MNFDSIYLANLLAMYNLFFNGRNTFNACDTAQQLRQIVCNKQL